jgi:hypothetical protein
VKKNRWVSIHNFFRIGLPFYILFFLFLLSVVSNIEVTYAARGQGCFPFICTPTPVPTPTPAPIPTPIPTPIPYVPPTPTSYVPPVAPLVTPTPVPITPTPTLQSATATIVTVSSTQSATAQTAVAPANQQSQGAGDNAGKNIVVLSLGIAIPVLLVAGGMILFLRKRQASQEKPATQEMYNNAQAQWMNNYDMPPNPNSFQYASYAGSASDMAGMSGTAPNPNSFQYASYAGSASDMAGMSGTAPNPNSFQYASYAGSAPDMAGMSGTAPRIAGIPEASTAFVPSMAGVPAALIPSMSGSMPVFGGGAQQMPSPQLTYTPSDLRPITTTFPQQMLTGSLDNGVRPAQNGDLLPLPIDTLSYSPQLARAKDGNWNERNATGPIATFQSLMDTPIPFQSSPLPVLPVPLQAMRPPSIKEDPMLEETMRQAQIGLFALLGR